jgi:heme ABC exporter ATP-binding subunit CcmA
VNLAAELHDVIVAPSGFPVLSGLTLEVQVGECLLLEGANGAGKTSALRLLGGLSTVISGHGQILGVDIATGDRREIRRRVGWLGHEGSFYDELTVEENLTYACRLTQRPRASIADAIERVGLGDRRATRTGLLSAGQHRRVALAWLLILRPRLWLLDEPFAALDATARALLHEILRDATQAGASIVMSSHEKNLEFATAPRRVTLLGGRAAS